MELQSHETEYLILSKSSPSTVAASSSKSSLKKLKTSDSDFCKFDNIFGAGNPPYYVNYKTATPPVIDGSLDDPAWKEVEFTVSNPDICGYDGDGPCSTAGNCAKGCAKPR